MERSDHQASEESKDDTHPSHQRAAAGRTCGWLNVGWRWGEVVGLGGYTLRQWSAIRLLFVCYLYSETDLVVKVWECGKMTVGE